MSALEPKQITKVGACNVRVHSNIAYCLSALTNVDPDYNFRHYFTACCLFRHIHRLIKKSKLLFLSELTRKSGYKSKAVRLG